MENTNRRKKYLVDLKFQGKVFAKFALIACFSCLLTFIAIYSLVYQYFQGNPKLLLKVVIACGSSMVVSVIVAAIYSLFFSHKIAGPVYRFKKVTEEVGKGNFDLKVKIRTGDEFHDLADSLNEMLEKLSDKKYSDTQESRYSKFGPDN